MDMFAVLGYPIEIGPRLHQRIGHAGFPSNRKRQAAS
jgi:hypothetical protein